VPGTYNGNNYLPLLPIAYRGARKVLFRLLDLLTFTPTTEDDGLLPALELLRRLRLTRSAVIPASVSVTFANEQWQRTVVVMHGKRRKKRMFDRRLFELCVFSALADGLRTGDLALQGSERYADYRTHLLSWDECQPLLADYCRELGLAGSAQGSVFQLWIWLKGVAEDVDGSYPDQSDLVISEEGVPTLKRLPRRPIPQELAAVEAVIGERMPDRDVLEILCAVAHWTDWPRHFGPRSGFDPKLANATERHILTTFCYGCNLGPAQTERHTRRRIDAQQLATLNRQHVTIQALEAARRDIINCFNQLGLPAFWGDSTIVGVDGTQYDLAEENLVAEYSFRYRTRGGIAYHHVSDRYIALFAHFITCGTWEAIYLIDGLLNNTSEIQPTTVHGDTQAQSTPVFALCYLLGIDLLPRIRNWQDLVFFRASSAIQYQHIDALFKDEVDWELLERHWQDLMQVALSIKMGKVLPSTLLRKLRHDSKKNKLYKVFRELGYVIRTIVLLRIISSLEMRQQIQGTTNKVEAYQGFSAWITFGNDGMIATNDPVEQEKRMHYKDVVANAVILHNTVDLARLLMELRQEGYPITKEVVARLSPYLTRHIRRFGEYTIDVHVKPAPIEPDFELPD
jgi:TnpA family transposase